MPRIDYTKLPAGMAAAAQDMATGEITYYPKSKPRQTAPIDPYRYANDQFKQGEKFIKQQYGTQWKELRRSARNERQFKQGVDRLIGQTDSLLNKLKFQHQQQRGSLDKIKQLVGQQVLSPEAGQQAMERLTLPKEIMGAMYPSGKTQTPYSMSQIMGSISESITEFAEAADEHGGLEWGPPKKKKESLLNMYLQWRNQIGYDYLSPLRRSQLDQRWDSYMLGDDAYNNWWADKKKRTPDAAISAMRATGKIGKAMQKRVVGSGIPGQNNVSLIGASVAKSIKRDSGFPSYSVSMGPQRAAANIVAESKVSEPKAPPTPPAPDELRKQGTKEAYKLGIKLGYWSR